MEADQEEEPEEEQLVQLATGEPSEMSKQLKISTQAIERQPHHRDADANMTELMVIRQYEQCMFEAISVAICNYSTLNLAINMGFSARN